MDSDGIIRVGGRLANADVAYDTKHPIIVANGSRLCKLIIADAHSETQHGAVQVMIQYVRGIQYSSFEK